mmetsp:Transcript_31692/g.38834  ORF Transcript_31692/g.38834 Transcript_31692/m.38834 type:complete len:107 (-) Transcript_31692:614-934(-)
MTTDTVTLKSDENRLLNTIEAEAEAEAQVIAKKENDAEVVEAGAVRVSADTVDEVGTLRKVGNAIAGKGKNRRREKRTKRAEKTRNGPLVSHLLRRHQPIHLVNMA